MAGPLLAVDAPSLLYRAYHALPRSIVSAVDGTPVNALLGAANLILQTLQSHSPRAVAVCFGAEAAHYRIALYPAYHADRPPMPEELVGQWSKAPAFFAAFGWTVLSEEELEADDILGALAAAEAAHGGSSLLFTGDRDMFQCVGPTCSVLFPGGKRGPELIDEQAVRERYGIAPAQVPDFIALRVDPSDGLPGARGIGAKTAAELLRVHGNIESLLAAADSQKPGVARALREQAFELRAFKHIATLQPVEVPPIKDGALDASGAAAAAREHGINRLAERLEALAG